MITRAAMALALGLAIVGGIAWQSSGTAGASFLNIAVNWRGGGGTDNAPPAPPLAVNWRGTGGNQQSIVPPPAS
jgi:hypothetical protein